MMIAEQGFVADAVGPARLSARKPPDGDVVQPLALDRHRDIQLERGSRDDPDRDTFVLMEKVGEAVCLIQHLFCRYSVHHCNAARRPRTFSVHLCSWTVAFSEFCSRRDVESLNPFAILCVVRWAITPKP